MLEEVLSQKPSNPILHMRDFLERRIEQMSVEAVRLAAKSEETEPPRKSEETEISPGKSGETDITPGKSEETEKELELEIEHELEAELERELEAELESEIIIAEGD